MANLLERQKIVPLISHTRSDLIDYAKAARFVSGLEVFLEDALRQSRQLLAWIHGLLDNLCELSRTLHVSGLDAEIVEGEMAHPLGKQDGHGVRLLSHRHAGVPNARMVASRQRRKTVIHDAFQYVLVSKEERECHCQHLFAI